MTIQARRSLRSGLPTRSFRRSVSRPTSDAVRREGQPLRTALLLLTVIGVSLAGCTAVGGSGPTTTAGAQTIRVDLLNFRFDPSTIDVAVGEEVRFVAVNPTDLPHELFVGSPAEQDSHARLHAGAAPAAGGPPEDAAHGVYVAAHGTAQFTYRFEEAGDTLMGCHLVGHWEAGMVGVVRVHAP